jgi:hypothetical protein
VTVHSRRSYNCHYSCILICFCNFVVTCLNKDYSDSRVVDVNSFMAFELRRMSFDIGLSTPRAEEYELSMHCIESV